MPDTDSFVNITTLNGDSVVGVNLKNWKGTGSDEIHFVAIVKFDENGFTNLIIMANTAGVSFKETAIDESLSMFCKGHNVSKKRNVKKHVALKYKGARRIIAERSIGSAATGVHSSSESFVN